MGQRSPSSRWLCFILIVFMVFDHGSVFSQVVEKSSMQTLEDEMEKALAMAMRKEAVNYYSLIGDFDFVEERQGWSFHLFHETPSEESPILFNFHMGASERVFKIFPSGNVLAKVNTPILTKDTKLFKRIEFRKNKALSQRLGESSEIFFLKEIELELSDDMQYTVKQESNHLTIHFFPENLELFETPKEKAGPSSPEDESPQEIIYEPIVGVAERLSKRPGDIFRREEQRSFIRNNNESTALDVLNAGLRTLEKSADYNLGINKKYAHQDYLFNYPKFGSLDYWKKHIDAVLINGFRYDSNAGSHEGKAEDAFVYEPELGLSYLRTGTYTVRGAYRVKRELPFYFDVLGPANGNMRQDFKLNTIYAPGAPYEIIFDHDFNVSSNENTNPQVSVDRIYTYRYQPVFGVDYHLKRNDLLKFRTGLNYQTRTKDDSEDFIGFLNTSYIHNFHERLRGYLSHDYTNILRDASSGTFNHVHLVKSGVSYDLSEELQVNPEMTYTFIDDDFSINFSGDIAFEKDITHTDVIGLSYKEQIVRDTTNLFRDSSITSSNTNGFSSGLQRLQEIAFKWTHQFTEHLTLSAYQSLRRSGRIPGLKMGGGIRPVTFSRSELKLIKHMKNKKWAWELSYAFNYSHRDNNTSENEIDKSHVALFKIYRFFGSPIKLSSGGSISKKERSSDKQERKTTFRNLYERSHI